MPNYAYDPLDGWDSQMQKDFVERGRLKDPVTGEFLPVTSIGGTGRVTGQKLADLGFPHAYQLVGQYMVCSLDDEAFGYWLKTEVGVQRPDLRHTIVGSLRKWCERHL